MGVTDWEPRALPSEARCRVWAGLGGVFLACDEQGGVATMPAPAGPREYVFAVACGEGGIRVRPWLKGEPAGWNASFYPMTHPPIPEGWGVVKEWELRLDNVIHNGGSAFLIKSDNHNGLWHSGDGYFCKVRRILPAIPAGWEAVGEWHDTLSPCSEVYDWTLLADGRIVQRGETFRGKDERIMGVHIRRVLPDVDWGDVPRGVWMHANGGLHGCMCVRRGNGTICGTVSYKDGEWYSKPFEAASEREAHRSLPAAIVALTGRRHE